MNGLFKILSLTVPAIALVIFLTYHQQQEHKSEMRAEGAAFDRDWNDQMANFTNKAGDKAKYKQRAVAAQSQYSSRRLEFESNKKAVERLGHDMGRAMDDADKRGPKPSLEGLLKEGH